MKTLAQFKREANGATLTLTEALELRDGEWVPMRHKFLNIPRKVRVRSADMVLTDADGNDSYMQFGRASNWLIDGDRATFKEIDVNEGYGAREYGTQLVYRLDRGKEEQLAIARSIN